MIKLEEVAGRNSIASTLKPHVPAPSFLFWQFSTNYSASPLDGPFVICYYFYHPLSSGVITLIVIQSLKKSTWLDLQLLEIWNKNKKCWTNFPNRLASVESASHCFRFVILFQFWRPETLTLSADAAQSVELIQHFLILLFNQPCRLFLFFNDRPSILLSPALSLLCS